MTKSRPAAGVLGLLIGLFLAGVALDQVTKAWVVARLTPGESVPLVSDIFQLQLLRNSGAAFSTGSQLTVVFSVLALVVLVAVAIWVVPRVRCRFWAVLVGLGAAGVAGNFIDRLFRAPGVFRGHVVDFFALKHFAVFNLADVFLTAAAVLIVLDALFFKIDLDGHRSDQPADRSPVD